MNRLFSALMRRLALTFMVTIREKICGCKIRHLRVFCYTFFKASAVKNLHAEQGAPRDAPQAARP
jgi:hypothetical protein